MQADRQTGNHGSHWLPWLSLCFATLLGGCHLLFGGAPEALVYDRSLIQQGEVWRLATGHLVHLDQDHLAWNLVAFLALGAIMETALCMRRRDLLTVMLAGATGVSAYLWGLRPDITLYCGLSTLLNTQLAVCLVTMARRQGPVLPLLVGFGALAKITYESLQGGSLVSTQIWPSLPDAHLAGFVCGLLWAGMLIRLPFTLPRRQERI